MKIKIISDGTPMSTRVVNADTGEVIEGITACTIVMDAENHFIPFAHLTFVLPMMDLKAKLHIVNGREIPDANQIEEPDRETVQSSSE